VNESGCPDEAKNPRLPWIIVGALLVLYLMGWLLGVGLGESKEQAVAQPFAAFVLMVRGVIWPLLLSGVIFASGAAAGAALLRLIRAEPQNAWDRLLFAAAMLDQMPDSLRSAARGPDGARALIYALLLDRDPQMRRQQLDALKAQADPSCYQQTERLAPLVDALQEQARMPLIQTTFPALKALSPQQYDRFRQNVVALIQADGKVDLFEYTVHAMVLRFLDVHFGLAKPPAVRHRKMGPLVSPVVGVLSTMAYAGSDDEAEIGLAFDKGMAEIGQAASLLPESDCSVRKLDEALRVLVGASPLMKKQILAACVACIAADGIVTPREGELVAAVSSMLGVPLPPIAATPA